MDKSTEGMIMFLGIAIVAAIGWHGLMRNWILASLLAAVTAAVSLQIVAYLDLGYLDPFFLIALMTTSVYALMIALVVGFGYRCWRRFRAPEQ